MRWQLPMHLLDALFFPSKGEVAVPGFQAAAGNLLKELATEVSRGYEQHLLQRSPHMVLLEPKFYTDTLQPLLAHVHYI